MSAPNRVQFQQPVKDSLIRMFHRSTMLDREERNDWTCPICTQNRESNQQICTLTVCSFTYLIPLPVVRIEILICKLTHLQRDDFCLQWKFNSTCPVWHFKLAYVNAFKHNVTSRSLMNNLMLMTKILKCCFRAVLVRRVRYCKSSSLQSHYSDKKDG